MTLPAPELDSTLPTVATRPCVAAGVALDFDDPLRGGGERVVAKRAHRRGAGVVGLAGEDELHAGLSGDGVDHAERAGFAFEHGALLDVELEIAEGGVGEDGRRELRGVEAEVADGVGDTDAAAIGASEGCGVELADQREAAEERFSEAHAFFFGEADDFDLERKAASGRCCADFLD